MTARTPFLAHEADLPPLASRYVGVESLPDFFVRLTK